MIYRIATAVNELLVQAVDWQWIYSPSLFLFYFFCSFSIIVCEWLSLWYHILFGVCTCQRTQYVFVWNEQSLFRRSCAPAKKRHWFSNNGPQLIRSFCRTLSTCFYYYAGSTCINRSVTSVRVKPKFALFFIYTTEKFTMHIQLCGPQDMNESACVKINNYKVESRYERKQLACFRNECPSIMFRFFPVYVRCFVVGGALLLDSFVILISA